MTFDGSQDGKPFTITFVDEDDSFPAKRFGVLAGDEIVAVGGTDCTKSTKGEVEEHLKKRPLELTVRRSQVSSHKNTFSSRQVTVVLRFLRAAVQESIESTEPHTL